MNLAEDDSLIRRYSITESLEIIRSFGYKIVVLQFPDDELEYSEYVYKTLSHGCDSEFYIAADTTFGSCCVDEVAAKHVDADLIIHYGHSCLSKPKNLPCYYVFPEKAFDVQKCVECFKKSYNECSEVFIVSEVSYSRYSQEVIKCLTNYGYDEIRSKVSQQGLVRPEEKEDNPGIPAGSKIFYIGTDSIGLTNLSISNPKSDMIWFDVQTNICDEFSCMNSKFYQRRFFLMEKSKQANIFGIIVGTLGRASDLSVLNFIKDLLRKHGKKSYTLAIGKPNPQKIANFLEIDCFVLLACPESSFLDSKEYYRPLISPFELIMALNDREFDPNYILNPEDIVKSARENKLLGYISEDVTPEKKADLVLKEQVTGLVDSRSSDLAIHLSGKVSNASEFLSKRSYKGLQMSPDEPTPAKVKQGYSGIPGCYKSEPST